MDGSENDPNNPFLNPVTLKSFTASKRQGKSDSGCCAKLWQLESSARQKLGISPMTGCDGNGLGFRVQGGL